MVGRLVLAVALFATTLSLAACGGGDDNGGGSPKTAAATQPASGGGSPSGTVAQSPSGEKNSKGQSVSGQLQLSGKLAGTFAWNKDLAVMRCFTNVIEFTLSDGKDTFISIIGEAATAGQQGRTTLLSGKLSGAYTGNPGRIDAKATASRVGATGSVTWSNTELKGSSGDTVTVNGKLAFICP